VFFGDLGATYSPLLASPESPYKSDIVVIESTYGDKNHQGRRDRAQSLEKVLIKAISDNGVVIFPTFSIGRTQELLYELEQITAKAKFKKLADIELIHRWRLNSLNIINAFKSCGIQKQNVA